jgi:hypothetical protein
MAKKRTKAPQTKQLLSPEQWKQFEQNIGMYSIGYVLIDGIPFLFSERRYKNQIVIDFYIAGWQYGKWIIGDHRFQKYFYKAYRWLLKKKLREKSYRFWKKLEGKKYADQWLENQRYSYYRGYFGSFRSLKSHLNKVAESIELLTAEEYQGLAEAYRKKHPEDFSTK